MSDRQRELLLLFSHRVEMDACLEEVRSRTYVPFRSARIGIGPRDARQRTAHLLDEYGRSTTVLCLGSAGWLIPKTPPPTPIWAREVKSESGKSYLPTLALGTGLLDRFGWGSARLVTVSRPVLDAERAIMLASDVGAEMVDMESRAVLQECKKRQVECGVIRVITDMANDSALDAYRARVAEAMGTLGVGVAELLAWLHQREENRLLREPE